MPTTRPGCLRPAASAVIDSEDVFDARSVDGGNDFFELAKQRALLVELLDDRFDDELCADAIAERMHCDDAGARCGRLLRIELALGGEALQRFANRPACFLRRAHARIEEADEVSGLRGDLRDARTHRPAADDGDRRIAWQCAGGGHARRSG